MLSLGKDE